MSSESLLLGKESQTTTNKYCYKPLGEYPTDTIRLLKLSPGRKGDAIKCSFQYTLSDSTEYTALSYVWGDQNEPPVHEIFVDRRLLLTHTNLLHGLHHIRDETECLTFWIDAICINQGDEAERKAQLKLMPRIYHAASVVLAWLGVNTAVDRPLEGLIPYVFRSASIFGPHIVDAESARKLLAEAPMVADICARAYWSRLWTLPETLQGAKPLLQYGSQKVSWDCFQDWCYLFGDLCSNRKMWQLPTSLEQELSGDLERLQLQKHINDSGILRRGEDRVSSEAQWTLIALVYSVFDGDQKICTIPSHATRSLEKLTTTYGHLDCGRPEERVKAFLALAGKDNDKDFDYENNKLKDPDPGSSSWQTLFTSKTSEGRTTINPGSQWESEHPVRHGTRRGIHNPLK